MARIAWFTPLPPISSGIAQYNVELLPHLSPIHEIDLFVDGQPEGFMRPDGWSAAYSAHDFVWKHFRHPYDLIVYQLGNAPCHDYMWGYLVRYPGMVVLHDGQLHHARARWLLQRGRQDDYRSEFLFNHPDADVELAELGIAGRLGSLTYFWPMLRTVVDSTRLVVVHNDWLASRIREDHPDARVEVITMGVPAPVAGTDAHEAVRRRHGIPTDEVLFTAVGKVTPEKRISQAIRALALIREGGYRAHLLLVGEPVDHCDPHAEARALGVEDHVTAAGFVPDETISDYLAAADVCLCMRWPSSRETSASWLRCLAAGRPTITTDLVHTADIPALDPRTWTVHGASHAPSIEPACVSIDILDEDHSLWLAMRRLAGDARLRERLGRQARTLWSERFTLDRMVADYSQLIETARELPTPDSRRRAALPAHLSPDGSELTGRLLGQMMLPPSDIAGLWPR